MNATDEIPAVATPLDNIANAVASLQNLGVVRSRKWLADYGEWLVAAAFGGEVATSKTQSGWDVRTRNERIQVKTHSKAFDNPNRWTQVNPDTTAYDALAIVVLNARFRVEEMYKVPSTAVEDILEGKRVRWRDCQPWRLHLDSLQLPADFVRLFASRNST